MMPSPIPATFYTLVVRHPAAGSTWQLLDGDVDADLVRDRVMRLYQAEERRPLTAQELAALQVWTAALPVEHTFRFLDASHGWCRGRIIESQATPADIARRIGELNSER